MECDRLQRLVKNWYGQVQEEAMAPARMVSFMEGHIAQCQVCSEDPMARRMVDKITSHILPPSKVKPADDGRKEEKPEEETAEENDDDDDDDDDEMDDEDEY